MSKVELDAEISQFVSEHPEGWNHRQWSDFLHHLAEAGHDVSDADGVGLALESKRLTRTLHGLEVRGLGPKRIQGLADHFGTLWNLTNASREELAELPSISGSMADEILKGLR